MSCGHHKESLFLRIVKERTDQPIRLSASQQQSLWRPGLSFCEPILPQCPAHPSQESLHDKPENFSSRSKLKHAARRKFQTRSSGLWRFKRDFLSCASIVLSIFSFHVIVSSAILTSTPLQLNLGILVVESCDANVLAQINARAQKAIDDIRQQMQEEVGSNPIPLNISSFIYPFCTIQNVVGNLNQLLDNSTTHAIIALATYDVHSSIVPLAEIYGKAYLTVNSYVPFLAKTHALSLAPSFTQQAKMLIRVLDMYRWQTVYIVYTKFNVWKDFATLLYFEMTLSNFELSIVQEVPSSPLSPEDAIVALKGVGSSKVILMLLDVQDQLILLAAASSLSMTKRHAFFTFSTTPYDVKSLTLVGVTADVTSEPRFTNDSTAADVNIFESVFVIAASFPQDDHKTNTTASGGQRSKRDTSIRRGALKPDVSELRSDSLTFHSEKDITAIELARHAPANDSSVSSESSRVKWLSGHSSVYVNSENDNLVNRLTTAIAPTPPVVHKNTHVPQTHSKDDLSLALALAEDPPPTDDIIDKSDKSSGFSQEEDDKYSPDASSWKTSSKNQDNEHESWQSKSDMNEFQNSLFFASEDGNTPYELPQKSSPPLSASHIAGLKQRSKRDLQTFHLTDMDVNAVYDMVYILAYAVFRYFHNSSSGTLPNSYKLIQTISELTISGYSGMYLVDDAQRVTFDFAVYDFNSSSGVMERRVFYEATNATSWSMKTLGVISWPGRYILAPDECYKQVPNCNEGLQASFIAAIVTSALVLAIVVVIATLFIRRYWVNKEMTKGPNKVILSAEDLVFVMRKDMGKGSRILKSRATLLEKDNAPDLIRGSDPNRSMASINELSDYTETARFNGDLVHVKELEIKGFEMRSKLLTFIRMCRDLRHENLNPYVGFLADPIRPSIVMEYCSRGSLNDVIHNEDFKLDWDFKLSLLTDLVRGVRYLHSSPLKFHGHMTSKNCVIDSRFVLKITDYGVSGIMERCKAVKEYETRDLLWSAPELLRDPVLLQRGTDKGDLYAMAIIFQEVALRTEPYSTTGLTPEEVIKKLKKPPPLIRPSVTPQAAPPQFIQIMKQCWSEMPEMRPNIDEVYDQFKKLTGGKKANIVDTMFKMLEKYSTDLEDIVAERTMQLEEEKKKTDQLLFRMLPPTVAESLKIGRNVEAECFDEVTIYFSDIVGFTTISAMSTPMQVVDLLNDLYTMFDATINDHDVYKVETIGDAYMVVSGLPIRNGNRHAGEIGTLALVLLSQCGKFTIRHMPQVPLRLRIGLHTGSCVAGVVGLTMPRFCLFGDTVNTASRMESTGAAFRVHISQECKNALDILGGYKVEYRGQTELKGKGMHSTYWLVGKEGFDKELPEPPALVGDNTHGLDSILGDMKIDMNSALSVPADSLGKSSSAPNLIANAAISEENAPKPPGFQEHHKDSCTSKHNTSVITADINVTGRGHHKESTASHGETLDTILEAGTGAALKNRHSESNDSGFGSERKHSHGNDSFTVVAGASSSTGFGNDKLKRAKSSVVSSSDVSFHTNHSTVVDLGDELTPVTEV